MNKAILVTIITLFSSSLTAQKFDLQVIGYTPVVYEVDSVSSKELYLRIADWARLRYQDSSLLLTDSVAGKTFTLNRYAKRIMKYSMHKYDFEYKINFEFKEGKYRVNFEVGKLYTPNGDESYANYTSFFKKDGSIKYSGETAKTSLDIYFNALAGDIFKWMTETFDDHLEEEKKPNNSESDW